MNAFESLGLPVGLVISDEEIREAFRKRAAVAHPDSGGDEVEFSTMQAAREVLLSPAGRVKEWLAAQGLEVDARGQIEAGLMDLFQKVAECGSAAEAAIKEGQVAQSALAKAMAEVKLMSQRERVEELIAQVEGEITSRVSAFPEVETGGKDAAKVMRDLVFLEKWRGTLKGIYGRLM
ncbi:J domain-containing protein [Luteolibacter sp. AS25]|uniref:J domain-containing protein n=1 Tax=Luteolibacter sp. AS25 TaxID=3135776 RepID=UPI00398B10DD